MKTLDECVEALRQEIIESVQALVRIKSVQGKALPGMPFGENVSKALSAALEIARKQGFNTVDMEGYLGFAEYGTGEEYVAVLGHVDVVPEGSGWSYEPYGAQIDNGRIYGRGTIDDKGPIMAALFALKAIKNANLSLSKKVRIIFGTNEETGSRDMDYYNDKQHPPIAGFTPDGCFPVIFAEKGGLKFSISKSLNKQLGPIKILSINAGERINIVPNICEAELSADNPEQIEQLCSEFARKNNAEISTMRGDGKIIVKAYGLSAHASKPHLGKNAAMLMLAFLGELDLCSDIKDYLQKVNRYIGFDTTGKGLDIAFEDEVSGALTLNVGLLRMNENKISLTCDVRYPVTVDKEKILGSLNNAVNKLELSLDEVMIGNALYYRQNDKLVNTLLESFNTYTGLKAEPLAIGGGTYAKHMANIVAFGPQFPDEPDMCHQADEYIDIDKLILSTKIYAKAIYELAK